MCGRFALTNPEGLSSAFNLKEQVSLPPRYNIAPSQQVPVIVKHNDDACQLSMMRWGLIPSWAKDIKIGYKLINARAETAAEKPTFRAAFTKRRCLIPADAFYEWQHDGKRKQPYAIRMQDKRLFAMAGLWEFWKSPEGDEIYSCTILTTDANDLVRSIHERMPAILPVDDYNTWLDSTSPAQQLARLLQPFPSEKMVASPVGSGVNSPKNDHPSCLDEITP